ncbi:MAG: hypothetical protein ACK5NQ_04675 [Pseudomonas sp.]
MSYLDSLRGIVVLALLSLSGIVAMLVVDGFLDVAMFVLVIAPIMIGTVRAWRLARRRRPRGEPRGTVDRME